MAIIEELGLEVKIVVGGKAATEYPDTEPLLDLESLGVGQDTKASLCYIEAQEDMEFQIQFKVLSGKNPSADWLKPKSHVVNFNPSFGGGYPLQGVIVDNTDEVDDMIGIHNPIDDSIQKFRFSAVSTVESDDTRQIEKDTKLAQNLGFLSITVVRGVLPRSAARSKKAKPSTSGLGEKELTLAEKALKGKAVSLGATIASPVQLEQYKGYAYYKIKSNDRPGNPYALFCFKYRTRADLQKEMIIPRSRIASPEPGVDESLQEATVRPRPQTPSPQPAIDVNPQNASSITAPEVPSAQPVDDAMQALSLREALRLAGERLEALSYEEVLQIFGEGFKGLPLGRILRLAGEALDILPSKVVLRLAGERLEEIKNQEKLPKYVKREGEAASRSEQPPESPARIKREREDGPLSARPSKNRRTEGRKEAIDLTEDD